MKGTFKITLAYLKELGACRDGQREFQKAFPDGGEYQEVLDRCAEEDRVDLGRWLLEHVGPTEDVRVYEEAIDDADKNIIFAGGLDFRAEVKIRSLLSGCGIKAGRGIQAGYDFFIFAGLNVRKSEWEHRAIVTANAKPENLMSGCWRPKENMT